MLRQALLLEGGARVLDREDSLTRDDEGFGAQHNRRPAAARGRKVAMRAGGNASSSRR
jgi:hypothetical protein